MEGLKNKRILVTGGMGFVGSHVVETFVGEGSSVVVPLRSISPYSYFSSQMLDQRVIQVVCDLKDKDRVFDVVSKYDIEYIIHLAAQPLVTTAYMHPSETILSNIIGTVNVLESVRLFPHVKGIIVASSDKAYGKTSKPYKEEDPLQGDHPYDVSKSSADLITSSYHKTYGIPVVITRFGNIYGEGDLNFSRIIPGALQAILSEETFIVRSNGTFVRDYLYVKDVVNGYILLLQHMNSLAGEVFNFGSHYNTSVLSLLHDMSVILSKEIPYKINDNAINEIPYQSLAWDKAQRMIGWSPIYTLDQVLPSMYEWYKKYMEKTQWKGGNQWMQSKGVPLNESPKKSGTIFFE
jgi:CDP-glucose 4,6-dehydratase